jgi:hypothetical protein
MLIIPSPTKLRKDIVTLTSVRPSFRSSFRNVHPCEHSRINILQWILTKLGTYLVLTRIWNTIDFQGHRSKVKVTGSNFLARGYATLCVALVLFVYQNVNETNTFSRLWSTNTKVILISLYLQIQSTNSRAFHRIQINI